MQGRKEGLFFPSGPPEAALVSITRREESVILTDDIPQHNASSSLSLCPCMDELPFFIPASLRPSSSSFSPLFLHEWTSHTPVFPPLLPLYSFTSSYPSFFYNGLPPSTPLAFSSFPPFPTFSLLPSLFLTPCPPLSYFPSSSPFPRSSSPSYFSISLFIASFLANTLFSSLPPSSHVALPHSTLLTPPTTSSFFSSLYLSFHTSFLNSVLPTSSFPP